MSANIKEILIQEYTLVDIEPHIKAVLTDTSGAARHVANYFDGTSQIDCAILDGSFGIPCVMRILENTATVDGQKTVTTLRSYGIRYSVASHAIKGM